MARQRRSIRSSLDAVTVALFLVALWLPLLSTFRGWGRMEEANERRRLAVVPPRLISFELDSLVSYSTRLREFVRDHFGFRGTLVRIQSLAKLRLLSVSSNPKVIIGREGWLFYAGDRSLGNFTRSDPFSAAELKQWANGIEARAEWLRGRGVRYAFVLAPSKETVYPEYMPTVSRAAGPSRADQLSSLLQASTQVLYVDLRAALIEARQRGRLFHLTDRHWNDLGDYAADESIVAAGAFAPGRDHQHEPFQQSRETGPGGDLAGMLALTDVLREERVLLGPKLTDTRIRRTRTPRPGYRGNGRAQADAAHASRLGNP